MNHFSTVIHALILRESLSRLFSSRGAWFWLLAEPVVHIAFMMTLFTLVRMTNIGGIDTLVWLGLGMSGFFMFKRTSTQVSSALNANQALFTYQQVKPISTMIARALLEGYTMLMVMLAIAFLLALANKNITPDNPLWLMNNLFLLWLFGTGVGVMIAVSSAMIPETGRLIGLLMTPLYLLSGVIFPLQLVPEPYQSYLMLNPVAQGIEGLRASFAHYYHAVPTLDTAYFALWTLGLLTFGLALQHQFKTKLVER
jgi:capsular polysaccharide transport system permease protein